MPLDGLSFSNSGMFRIINSAETVAQAEQLAKQQAEPEVKQSEESEELKLDLQEKREGENADLQGRDTGEDEESEDENNHNILENPKKIKKYRVKFNQSTDMVELLDFKTGLVIETISPHDLISLISKSKGSSGILVDREV